MALGWGTIWGTKSYLARPISTDLDLAILA